MLSSENHIELQKKQSPQRQRFALKKLTVGVASILVGVTFMWGGVSANADSTDTVNQPMTATTTNTGETADSGSDQATTEATISQNANQSNSQTAHSTANSETATSTSQPAAETENASDSQAETPTPSYYNITVNFHDVTRNSNIQTLTTNW